MRQDAQFAAAELSALRSILTSGVTVLQENLRLMAKRLELGSQPGVATDVASRDTVATALDRSLQALQFDDMAVQLIDRVNARLLQLGQALRAEHPNPPEVIPLHSAADRDRVVKFGDDGALGEIDLF